MAQSGYYPQANDVFANGSGALVDSAGKTLPLSLNFRYDETNTAVGVSAYPLFVLNGRNTATGANAMQNPLLTGSDNSAHGYQALKSITSGSRHTAHGSLALSSMQGNSDCTAVGYGALQNATGNNKATCVGSYAGNALTTDTTNPTAVGYGALKLAPVGGGAVAVGYNALGSQTLTASGNTCVGTSAGGALNSVQASNNTLVGYQAGGVVSQSGHDNTFVGAATDSVSADLFGSIALGSGAIVYASGQLAVGSNTNVITCQNTVGAAGASSALPGAPLGYLQILLNNGNCVPGGAALGAGTTVVIPYWRSA